VVVSSLETRQAVISGARDTGIEEIISVGDRSSAQRNRNGLLFLLDREFRRRMLSTGGSSGYNQERGSPKNSAVRFDLRHTPTLLRHLGVVSATALVVSNTVGTGIFAFTGYLVGDLGSPKLILLIWLTGALCALAGAFCYSELGVNFPSSGGEYVYLTRAFGLTRLPPRSFGGSLASKRECRWKLS
jgi:hypothetical protein